MRATSVSLSALTLAWTFAATVIATPDGTAFLTRYCLDCHSAEDPSGEREFTSLDLAGNGLEGQLRLQEIVDQLTLETMPPEDGEQPSESERLAAIEQFTKILTRMRAVRGSTGGRGVLRRLSRREYRNTVSDLLGIDMTMFDPTQAFPDDALSAGFDNIGSALTTSGYLLEQYLEAAAACVSKAFDAMDAPAEQEWIFKDRFYQQPELARAHEKAFEHRYLVLYDHPRNDKPEGAYGPLVDFDTGVPADGVYEVRVRAQALHRDTSYGPKAIHIDTTEPFRMGIRAGDTRIPDLVHTQPMEPQLAEVTIADDTLQWYRIEIPLDRGFAPRFTFENGHHDIRGAYGRVFKHHRDTLPEAVRNGKGIVAFRNAVIKHGYLPQIRIHEVRIRGPLAPTSPARADVRLWSPDSGEDTEASLRPFIRRAFRRPATAAEVASYAALYRRRMDAGRNAPQAFQDTLVAVLCSPGFLYFHSQTDDETELTPHALAERLSYFLTSSMPDAQLSDLADNGQLAKPEVLRREAERLLQQPTGERFVGDFLDSWLKLRSLGSMPPDVQQFRVYYAAGLEEEMKTETHAFFHDLLLRNGSALELLTAQHSFVNRDLAKLYQVADQVPAERAGDFHRVVFSDSRRAGLLGHASVLTVSANGIETSPVIRGVWLLENILGTPPPPPPDDVPAIDPDVRGTQTIRDQLQKHRASATCNQCHRKIDPLGFALEGFDPIGRLRTHYDRKRNVAVETSGELPGGQHFSGPAQLRQILIDRKAFFLRTLTDRLLTHALGRRPEAADRPALDGILASVREDGTPLRDLLLAIIDSELFRQY